ncbi:c-type cytochrome biogenesis protein [Avibacterium sp. 21-586]|uniref:tetratricopeptide repeat protein n=1 Tax=Avibacterium sp. 21-586 TaxID=2911534 RepID=UPI0022466A6D|nr:c-type cytochrome biogenesis protein [Avibacterium sp. 21-586]MCW9710682.1 c-type cytochrome biogenesis protein [Avibacterium sp. 21-586]
MTFFIGVTLLVLISLGLWLPLGRGINWQKNYRQQQNIALYQQQMKDQLDPELAQEFAQRLLDDEKQLEKQPHFVMTSTLKSRPYFVALSLLLIALPMGYYFSLDRFSAEQQHQQQLQAKQVITTQSADPFVESFNGQSAGQKNETYVEKIEQRLRQNPNNSEAWIELGQAYMQNNEFDNALVAYSYADRLTGGKPAILGLAANTLYQKAGQKITPQVKAMLEQALSQDPKEASSLSLLAGEAFVQTDYPKAIALWQKVLDSDKSGIDRRTIIKSMQMAEMLQNAKKGAAQ